MGKERGLKIEINLTNKWVYSLVFFGVILFLGVFIFAYNSGKSPSVIGHTAEEIDGLDEYILDIVSPLIEGISYSESQECGENNLVYDSYSSGIASKPGWKSIELPSRCRTMEGCSIVQKVYDKNGLKVTRTYTFSQDGSRWTSSANPTKTYTNGDTTSTNIFPSIADGNIVIRDDHKDCEVKNTYISIRDNSGSYGQRVYIC